MPFFLSVEKERTFDIGVLLDVTPTNVDIAIVKAQESLDQVQILWAHKEPVPSEQGQFMERRVFVAILNAFSELGSLGLATLRKQGISTLPNLVQVSISAPFTYTVSRNVLVKSAKPFRVTRKLVTELERRAVTEVTAHASGELVSKRLNLTVLSDSTAALTVNGYPMQFPFKSTASEVVLCQVVAMGPSDMVEHIKRCQEKVLPQAAIDIDSFMSLYLRALNKMAPKADDACLVASFGSVTELMVQRDGIPQSSVFADTKGSRSQSILDQEGKLTQLFDRTNDGLALPRNMYVFQPSASMDSSRSLQQASRFASGTHHQVFSFAAAFLSRLRISEINLAFLAMVFHHRLYEDTHLADMENMLK